MHTHRPPSWPPVLQHGALRYGKLPVRLARVLVLLGLLAVCGTLAASEPAPIVVIPVSGAIGPASADFIVRSLARAEREHAQLAVLELDTPGGLDTSMRQIIKAILASPVPVASFVAPSGARAASAGTYIVYASHIAAMAPGTNIGAASPVQLGIGGGAGPSASPRAASPASAPLPSDTESTEMRKATHDAEAYIRSLAQLRGRNADWAERAVREAVSLPANDARAQHVVDLVATDTRDLARQLNGRLVTTRSGVHRLDTANAPLETLTPDWRSRFLGVITDPNVALILLAIGMYGLFFEFMNPGFVLPGVTGAICMLTGLFALQMLPVNTAGVALVVLGLAFLIAEAFLPTFGVLGFGGIAAFALGAVILINTDVPGYGIPWPLIAGLSTFGALFVFTMSGVALRARRRPVVTGAEALIGSIGEVLDDGLLLEPLESSGSPGSPGSPGSLGSSGSPGSQAPQAPPKPGGSFAPPVARPSAMAAGWARIHGERWRVASATPIPAGRRVRVTSRSGLTLTVAPLYDDPAASRGEPS